MNNLKKNIFSSFLILLILPHFSFAQTLSRKSEAVKLAFDELERQPDSKPKQIAYLKNFPQNKQQFIAVFDQNDFSQLYSDSYKYIAAFAKLSNYYPKQVIDKAINIGKDLKYNADAIGFLQNYIVALGNQHIKIFSAKLRSLPELQANNLISFLADVENHNAYPEYQQLINSFNKADSKDLADRFIKARSEREKEKNH